MTALRVYNGWSGHAPSGSVYIGGLSPFAGPFRVGKDGTRAEVSGLYRQWAVGQLRADPHFLDSLIGKNLIDYSFPIHPRGAILLDLAAYVARRREERITREAVEAVTAEIAASEAADMVSTADDAVAGEEAIAEMASTTPVEPEAVPTPKRSRRRKVAA